MFHLNNAPVQKSMVAMAFVRDCGFELVDHPRYHPDLGPSDYFLFPKWKKTLGWEAVSDRWWGHISTVLLKNLLRIMIKTITRESQHCNTGGRSVWAAWETIVNFCDFVFCDEMNAFCQVCELYVTNKNNNSNTQFTKKFHSKVFYSWIFQKCHVQNYSYPRFTESNVYL